MTTHHALNIRREGISINLTIQSLLNNNPIVYYIYEDFVEIEIT